MAPRHRGIEASRHRGKGWRLERLGRVCAGCGASDLLILLVSWGPRADCNDCVADRTDDYLLELLNSGGGGVGSSDRGQLGVEEAMQVNNLAAGNYTIRVTVLEAGPNDSIFDLDDDGTVGVPDLLILLSAWGKNPGHPADFNGDGTVGVSDLLALLANWGAMSPENDYILEVLSRN